MVAGDHRILELTEQILELVEPVEGPSGAFRMQRGDHLDGVAQPLGALAGAVHPLVPFDRIVGPRHLRDPFRDLPRHRLRGPGQLRRLRSVPALLATVGFGEAVDQRVERPQQLEIAPRIEGVDRLDTRGGGLGGEVLVDPGSRRLPERHHRKLRDPAGEPLVLDLEIACGAQALSEPTQFSDECGVEIQIVRVRLDRAAQPACGLAHAVDGIDRVASHRDVGEREHVPFVIEIFPQVSGRPLHPRGRRDQVAEDAVELRRARRPGDSGCGEPVLDGVEQRDVAGREFHLDLTPVQFGVVRAADRGHVVDDDLREQRSVRVAKALSGTGRGDERGQGHGFVADHAPQQSQQRRGHRIVVGEGHVQFRAGVRARGQLHVPAGVVAALATPHGDSRAQQSEVRGVEVLCGQFDHVGVDRCDAGHGRQVG